MHMHITYAIIQLYYMIKLHILFFMLMLMHMHITFVIIANWYLLYSCYPILFLHCLLKYFILWNKVLLENRQMNVLVSFCSCFLVLLFVSYYLCSHEQFLFLY